MPVHPISRNRRSEGWPGRKLRWLEKLFWFAPHRGSSLYVFPHSTQSTVFCSSYNQLFRPFLILQKYMLMDSTFFTVFKKMFAAEDILRPRTQALAAGCPWCRDFSNLVLRDENVHLGPGLVHYHVFLKNTYNEKTTSSGARSA